MNLAQLKQLSKRPTKSGGEPASPGLEALALPLAVCVESRARLVYEVELAHLWVKKAGSPSLLVQEQLHESCTLYGVVVVRLNIPESQRAVQCNSAVHFAGQSIEPHALIAYLASAIDNSFG